MRIKRLYPGIIVHDRAGREWEYLGASTEKRLPGKGGTVHHFFDHKGQAHWRGIEHQTIVAKFPDARD